MSSTYILYARCVTNAGSLAVMRMPPHMHRWAPPSLQSAVATAVSPDTSPRWDISGTKHLIGAHTSPARCNMAARSGSHSFTSPGYTHEDAQSGLYFSSGKLEAKNVDLSPVETARGAFGSYLGPQTDCSSRRAAGSFLC